MSSAKEEFAEILKNKGYRLTKSRMAVFNSLYGREPLSMRELIGSNKDVNRASIYRTVELFEELDVAQRLYMGWKYKIELTDKFTVHHHHLTCLRCGKTIAIDQYELERYIDKLAAQRGFKPTTHQVEVQGLCSQCQKKVS